jgi:hypothetical protein
MGKGIVVVDLSCCWRLEKTVALPFLSASINYGRTGITYSI